MQESATRTPFSDSRSVAAALRQDILEGNYQPGSALPSVREIADRFNVGLRLSRNALRVLVEDGYAYTRERQGTFVSEREMERGATHGALRRVVVVERHSGTLPPYNHVAYLESYGQVLEQYEITMELARAALGGATDARAWFDPEIPLTQQGCILVNVLERDLLHQLSAWGVPYVVQNFITYPAEGLPEHSSVVINKVAGAFDATNYLLGLGHRRIGFMGNLPTVPEPDEFLMNVYDGFSAAMKCAAVEIHPRYLAKRALNDEQGAMELARQYVERTDMPTAILAQCDMQAACLIRAATERGIRVPEELSIVGFDGLEEFAATEPPLTTVNDPRRVLAGEAAKLLCQIAEQPELNPRRLVIPCQLTIRQSAAQAPEPS